MGESDFGQIDQTIASGNHDNVVNFGTSFDIVVFEDAVVIEKGHAIVVQLDVIALYPFCHI